MAGCARHSRTRRVLCVNLGEKVSVPSPSSLIGVCRFTKSNIAAVPRDDVIEHSPDHGAAYMNVYHRFDMLSHPAAPRRRIRWASVARAVACVCAVWRATLARAHA